MQSVQRHFGRYMKRSADEQQVSLLLKDFEDADQLLAKLIDASKAWREAWLSILTYQHRLVSEFELLYVPILGASEGYQGHTPAETPENVIKRTTRMKVDCEDLKKELKDMLEDVDLMMIKPASEAKDNLHSMRKTIKKREDKKLDFERYQGRVDTLMKKTKRSDRDNVALAKAEKDLTVATELYKTADDHLKKSLPPVLIAVYSLQPHLLSAQIQIQNSLLAHYYTVLHTYCTEEGFPNPAPPMDEVIRTWDDAVRPIQKEIESINILATGKTVRTGQQNGQQGGTSNGHRRTSQTPAYARRPSVSPARAIATSPPISSTPTESSISNNSSRPKPSTTPSSNSLLLSPTDSAVISPSTSSRHSSYATPSSTTAGFAPAGPNVDYFSRDRQPSQTSSSTHFSMSAGSPSPSSLSSLAAGKKRPPPPPPRMNSHQHQFVTALYDFGGQSDGDLVFKEGDRIKVIKKTESTDDWWQGELKGVKGMFPANYCQ